MWGESWSFGFWRWMLESRVELPLRRMNMFRILLVLEGASGLF